MRKDSTVVEVPMKRQLKARLDKLAEATNRSEEEIVEDAVATYLAINDRQIEEIRAGLREAEAGGPFISHEAMTRWLESWGADDELPPPNPE